jgi:hypothetical protein
LQFAQSVVMCRRERNVLGVVYFHANDQVAGCARDCASEAVKTLSLASCNSGESIT